MSNHVGGGGGGSDDNDSSRIWLQQLERRAKGFLKRSVKGWFYIHDGSLRRTNPGTKTVDTAADKVVCKLFLSTFKEDGANGFRLITNTGKDYQFKAANAQMYIEWKSHILSSIEQGLANLLPASHSDNGPSDAELEKRLLSIRQANPTCADCGKPSPEWASINLGIMFCVECSGTHRNLGTDVSEVRSLRLDKECWTPACIAHMLSTGNTRSNAEFEARLDPDDKPTANAPLEEKRDFIIAK